MKYLLLILLLGLVGCDIMSEKEPAIDCGRHTLQKGLDGQNYCCNNDLTFNNSEGTDCPVPAAVDVPSRKVTWKICKTPGNNFMNAACVGTRDDDKQNCQSSSDPEEYVCKREP